MENVRCLFCGGVTKTEELVHGSPSDPCRWDGIHRYITRCPKCFARGVEALTKEEAVQNWLDGKFTDETVMLRETLTPEDMDTEGAVKLAGAILHGVGANYQELWIDYLNECAEFDRITEQYPRVHQIETAYELATEAWHSVSQRPKHPKYKEYKRRYTKAQARIETQRREHPEYFNARKRRDEARRRAEVEEEYFETTPLLCISSVSADAIIRTLRLQAEQRNSDVTVRVMSGEKGKPEAILIFKHKSWVPFGNKDAYVYLRVIDGTLYVWSAEKKDGYKTSRVTYKQGERHIRSCRKDIVAWASDPEHEQCNVTYDGDKDKYRIE